MQGGLGKPLGYGSPGGWNGGMPFLLPCIDVSFVVVAVGSPDALDMSVCRVGLLSVCFVAVVGCVPCRGWLRGGVRSLSVSAPGEVWRLCAFTVCRGPILLF